MRRADCARADTWPTPARVPPVPTAQMKPSTLPSVCRQISGPGRLDNGRGGWRRCRTGSPRSRRSARSSRSRRRGGRRPSRSCSGWRTEPRAPGAARRRPGRGCPSSPGSACRGSRSPSGSPAHCATSARPMPVLPAVPSTITPPGRRRPRSSASLTINSAARSLTEPPGLRNSALPRISHPVISEARRGG